MAVESIHRTLANGQAAGQASIEELLLQALMAAHSAIRQAADADLSRQGMGTTAVMVWIPKPGHVAWVAHVGDSRAYLWRNGQLEHLTEDHTWLAQARRAKTLPADPDNWPYRHVLSQALGASATIAPEASQLTLQAGDVLLLCTDGLTDMLDDAEIAKQLSRQENPNRFTQALVSEANRQGGKDNITAVAIYVRRCGESSPATTDAGSSPAASAK